MHYEITAGGGGGVPLAPTCDSSRRSGFGTLARDARSKDSPNSDPSFAFRKSDLRRFANPELNPEGGHCWGYSFALHVSRPLLLPRPHI